MATPLPPQPPTEPPIDLEYIAQLKDTLRLVMFGEPQRTLPQMTFHHERDYAFRDLSTEANLENLLERSRLTPELHAPLLEIPQFKLALRMLWYEIHWGGFHN